jgi:hypothetical protein
MFTYNSYNEAFNNNDTNELDQMAKSIINKNKSGSGSSNKSSGVSYNGHFNNNNNNNMKIHKNNMFNKVKHNNKSFEKETLKGVEAFQNNVDFKFSPMDNFYDDKTQEYRGDFMSGLPTPLDNDSIDSKTYRSDSLSLNLDDNSQSPDYFNDITSEYSFLPKKKKNHLRMNNNHLQKYTENDDKEVLNHLKKCAECRGQLLHLLKNNGHVFNNNTTDKTDNKISNNINKSNNNESIIGKINYIEMKEIIILIMIGIIIIFVLDIFLRK